MRILSLLSAAMIASSLIVVRVSAQTIGQWDFNSGNLTATAGTALGDLLYADGVGGDTDLADAFGLTTALGISDINGTPASVMRFPAATNAMGYFMPAPGANGGGSFVNEYTIIFDLLYPSNGVVRPLVDADGVTYVAGADLIVNSAGGLGLAPNGPFDGTLTPNTWHRVGFVVNQGLNTIRKYIDGSEVGFNTLAGNQAGVDGRMALSPNGASTLLFANTVGAAGVGYVNSIQLRDVALNAGQMQALGGASATGIPQVIPPVPSFVDTRSPAINAVNVAPQPAISVLLNQGDTTINSGSIQLRLDGVNLATTVTPSSPTFTATATAPAILDPLSVHSLQVVWSDSVAGSKTNTWTFTVQAYQVVNRPAPFYLETFDGVAETLFPTGWYETNNTQTDIAGFDLTNPESDSYKSWVVISTNTLQIAKGNDPLIVPPIMVNGSFLPTILNNQLCYAESDSRGGSQVQMLFATNINCTARSNVFLSFSSVYQQNQDNIASVEYSINGGATWLPALYMVNDRADNSDLIRTNGVIDVGATLLTARTDQAYGSNYATYIGAPVSAALIPFISGRIDDDEVESIRVEMIRLPAADNQPNVSLRFMQAGTASWWFGVDDVGLYSINTPVITAQPQPRTISATETTNFTIGASSSTPLTYQWQHAGTNISNGGRYSGVNTATLTITGAEPADAGAYRCVLSNSDGPVTSASATLTVIDTPVITTQPIPVLVSAGTPASFTVAAMGRPPLNYAWSHDGAPVGGNTSTLTLPSTVAGDSGQYRVVVGNVTGSVTSSIAVLTVVSGPITSSLVAHLKFDGNYNDSSGRGNNATAVGSPTFNPNGRVGQAFQYTTIGGIEQHYATLGYPDDLKFGSATDFTISFWSKIAPGTKSSDPALVANKDWDSGSNPGYVLGVQGNNNFEWNYREESPNTRKDFDSAVNMTDGQWHHVIFSVQRGVFARTVIDGNLVDTRTIVDAGNSPSSIDTALAVNIGQDGAGDYNISITNALIDDVGFWRRALTTQEAQAIYNASFSGSGLAAAVVGGPVPAPQITQQPTNLTVSGGAPASFSVTATGGVPLAYQWRLYGTNLPGATSRIYTIAAADSTYAGEYTVVVSNPGGSVTSAPPAVLSVVSLPVISAQPLSRTNNQNLDVTFSVTASGGSLTYQWKHYGTNIAGATTSSLALDSIYPAQAGPYTVEVGNNIGPVLSDTATLTVIPVPAPRLIGQWDFANGLAGTLGLPLEYFDAKVQTDTAFGTTTSFGIGNIAGNPAGVMRLVESSSPWGGYRMHHQSPPNGGGTNLNQYTLIFDVYYPPASHSQWRTFYQTSLDNSGDGEFFVNTGNGIGVSSVYQGNVTPEAWHRIAFAVDLSSPLSPAVAKWIDGVKVGYQTGLSGGRDGRFSLNVYALLFGDNDGDQSETYVSSVQLWNGKLPDPLLASMGTPTANKLPGAITARKTAGGVEIYRTGGLGVEQSDSLSGPWTEVVGAANPLVVPGTGAPKYYRPKF